MIFSQRDLTASARAAAALHPPAASQAAPGKGRRSGGCLQAAVPAAAARPARKDSLATRQAMPCVHELRGSWAALPLGDHEAAWRRGSRWRRKLRLPHLCV